MSDSETKTGRGLTNCILNYDDLAFYGVDEYTAWRERQPLPGFDLPFEVIPICKINHHDNQMSDQPPTNPSTGETHGNTSKRKHP